MSFTASDDARPTMLYGDPGADANAATDATFVMPHRSCSPAVARGANVEAGTADVLLAGRTRACASGAAQRRDRAQAQDRGLDLELDLDGDGDSNSDGVRERERKRTRQAAQRLPRRDSERHADRDLEDLESSMMARADLEQWFDRLFAEHGAAMTRLAASYTDRASDRDDLRQDIALAVWQALPRFRGECSERTFLFRIAHNRAIAWLSRTRLRARPLVAAADEEELDVADPAPDQEAGLARAQRGQQLLAAVHQLPLSYRQVVTLALEGLDYGDIAQVLGISETNVGARLTRARQMLRRLMENGENGS